MDTGWSTQGCYLQRHWQAIPLAAGMKWSKVFGSVLLAGMNDALCGGELVCSLCPFSEGETPLVCLLSCEVQVNSHCLCYLRFDRGKRRKATYFPGLKESK